MKYKIRWTKSAEKSLDEILDYIIENDGLNIGYKIYEKIKSKVKLLNVSPFQGRKVNELKSIKKNYYEIIIKPWRIIYTVEDEKIFVLLVIDSRRDLEEILYEIIINLDTA